MSRVAKAPITIPEGVNITQEGGLLSVKGKLGEMTMHVNSSVQISTTDNVLTFAPSNIGKKEEKGAWAQAGNLVVCGNAGEALGDSIYEANIYILGEVKSLGADCIEKKMTEKHKKLLTKLLAIAKIKNLSSKDFRRYGSARSLYNFKVDNTY